MTIRDGFRYLLQSTQMSLGIGIPQSGIANSGKSQAQEIGERFQLVAVEGSAGRHARRIADSG